MKLTTWAQFHQRSMYSFYARRSRMCKKRQSSEQCYLALLGPTSIKTAHKMLVKLTPWSRALFFPYQDWFCAFFQSLKHNRRKKTNKKNRLTFINILRIPSTILQDAI